jgi:anti-anti-sigma factor
MVETIPGWSLEVSRGPDWLFVRLRTEQATAGDVSGLSESLWDLMQRQFIHRLVLELEDLPQIRSALIGELVRLQKRICTHGGLLRLAGLSNRNQEVLRSCRLDACFPQYHTREDAVMGQRARKPR